MESSCKGRTPVQPAHTSHQLPRDGLHLFVEVSRSDSSMYSSPCRLPKQIELQPSLPLPAERALRMRGHHWAMVVVNSPNLKSCVYQRICCLAWFNQYKSGCTFAQKCSGATSCERNQYNTKAFIPFFVFPTLRRLFNPTQIQCTCNSYNSPYIS